MAVFNTYTVVTELANAGTDVLLVWNGSAVKTITQANLMKLGTIDAGVNLFQCGDAQEYSIGWNGTDAIHTIASGAFRFTGGGSFFGTEANAATQMVFRRNAATIGGLGTLTTGLQIFGGSSAASHLFITTTGLVIAGTGITANAASVMEVHGATTPGGVLTLANDATTVNNGDTLGSLEFHSNDASADASGVRAFVKAVENDGGTGRSYDLQFGTGEVAEATTKAVLTKDGKFGVGIMVPTGQMHIDQSSDSGAIPVMRLDQGDVGESFIDFIGISAGDGSKDISSDNTTEGNKVGAIRVKINGDDRWLRLYDTHS